MEDVVAGGSAHSSDVQAAVGDGRLLRPADFDIQRESPPLMVAVARGLGQHQFIVRRQGEDQSIRHHQVLILRPLAALHLPQQAAVCQVCAVQETGLRCPTEPEDHAVVHRRRVVVIRLQFGTPIPLAVGDLAVACFHLQEHGEPQAPVLIRTEHQVRSDRDGRADHAQDKFGGIRKTPEDLSRFRVHAQDFASPVGSHDHLRHAVDLLPGQRRSRSQFSATRQIVDCHRPAQLARPFVQGHQDLVLRAVGGYVQGVAGDQRRRAFGCPEGTVRPPPLLAIDG